MSRDHTFAEATRSGWQGLPDIWFGIPMAGRILLVVLLALGNLRIKAPAFLEECKRSTGEVRALLGDSISRLSNGRPDARMLTAWKGLPPAWTGPEGRESDPAAQGTWTFADGTRVSAEGEVLAPPEEAGTRPSWRLRALRDLLVVRWVWAADWWPVVYGSAQFAFVLPVVWAGLPIAILLGIVLFLSVTSPGVQTVFLAGSMLSPLLSVLIRELPKRGKSGQSLGADAWRRIRRDRVAMLCMSLIYVYAVTALLTSLGELAPGENEEVRVRRMAWVGGTWQEQETRAGEYRPPSIWTNLVVRLFKLRMLVDSSARSGLREYLELGPVPSNEELEAERQAYATSGGKSEITIPDGDYAGPGADSLYPDERARVPGWFDFPFGTDFLGRDVFKRVIHGTRIAMSVGLVSCIIAIPIGAFFGALAGFYGGLVDELIVLLYSTVASVPGLLLLLAFVMVVGKGILGVYVALGLTSWVSLCRLIRGEFIKHKEREYVVAARSLGASDFSCIFKHILPNVFHIVIINFSLRFVYAVQSEVILSYLGVGVQGQPSWGIMINDAKLELARGVWWQLAGATFAMFLIVLALNIFGDILRDALDPKLRD